MQLEKILHFWKSRRPDVVAEGILKTWGALGVAMFAVIYYARYYRSGLNLGGEGGTVAVVAMRLMEGQRPIVDTFLGYNVMWFYPVAWLFELTGPNYIALRIFFFAICTVTGVLAFYVVRRVTGSGWVATLAALGPVLIPGMMFRNYMGFLAMLNMLMLLQAYVFEQRTAGRQGLWMAAAGAALGLTYLVRIDLGTFFTVITLGLVVLYPLGKRGELAFRARQAVGGLMLTVVMLGATHAPFYHDAVRRGYDEAFVGQYTGWIHLVRYLASLELAKKPEPLPAPVVDETINLKTAVSENSRFESLAGASRPLQPLQENADSGIKPETSPQPAAPAATPVPVEMGAPVPSPTPEEKKARDLESEDYLQKRSWGDFSQEKSFYDRAFVLITYLPIPVALLIVLPAALVLLLALVRGNFALRTEALAVLVTAGSALTLFPQYFFFRPDTPHLSEFMVPFLIAMVCALWMAVVWVGRERRRAAALWCAVLVLFCAADIGLYFYHSYPKESAGTIAARRKRKSELVAQNGVQVFLKTKERDELQQLCDLVARYTKPGDYLTCYPYAPTVNFMTDRPSFEYNLYVDNAYNVSTFHADTLREIGKYRPAAIVIDNRDINKTEDSRFKNWAAPTYAWIKENYAYAGTFRRQELYFRPDLYTPSPP